VKDPVFSKEDAYVIDYKHAYERGCEKGLRMVELIKKYNITKDEEIRILEKYMLALNYFSIVFFFVECAYCVLCSSHLALHMKVTLDWEIMVVDKSS